MGHYEDWGYKATVQLPLGGMCQQLSRTDAATLRGVSGLETRGPGLGYGRLWGGMAHGADLGEVADNVEALAVVLGHDVEEEGVGVVVEGLVVQEALCQQAQVLGVALGKGHAGSWGLEGKTQAPNTPTPLPELERTHASGLPVPICPLPCFSARLSQRRRWFPCGRSRCRVGAAGHTWSVKDEEMRYGWFWDGMPLASAKMQLALGCSSGG